MIYSLYGRPVKITGYNERYAEVAIEFTDEVAEGIPDYPMIYLKADGGIDEVLQAIHATL